jgi:hypothetical protein
MLTNRDQYNEMWSKFQNGTISEAVWVEFCDALLDEILIEHKDVFIRLKYR